MTDNANPHSADSLVQRGGIIGYRNIGAAGIVGVIAGNRLEHDRAVFGSPSHGPAMIEGKRIGDHTFPADPSIGRHEPGDAAERRRVADGSAGVCPQCTHHQSGCHRGGRARARTAGESMLWIPGVPYSRPRLVRRGTAMSKLQTTELTQQNGAGLFEVANDRRVLGRNMIDENLRMGRSSDARSFN